MVEHPAAGTELAAHHREVAPELGAADVLHRADRRDGVEAGLAHFAVVEPAYLGLARQARFLDCPGGPRRLLGGECHAQRIGAVVLRGMADQGAPAGAYVEQALPGTQVELAADQVDLLDLGLVQR